MRQVVVLQGLISGKAERLRTTDDVGLWTDRERCGCECGRRLGRHVPGLEHGMWLWWPWSWKGAQDKTALMIEGIKVGVGGRDNYVVRTLHRLLLD